MLGLEGKLLVVGGASRGLGRTIAEQLVAGGARVLLVARDADAIQDVAQELGGRAYPCAADLSEPSDIDQVAEAATRLNGLDGVLVNAGGPPFGPTLELSDDQWLDAFRSLIGGPVRLLRALVPHMNDGASVLFITSSSVRQPIENLDASNVLRPGVAALAKCLANELGPRIRVNSLAPGRIDTASTSRAPKPSAYRSKSSAGTLARVFLWGVTVNRRSWVGQRPSCSRPPHRISPGFPCR
jgi:3-oxoacyl-[acyl-carrier protein] reductase